MKKQTAVEWIEEVIDKRHMGSFLKSLIEKAKEMEKQAHEETWDVAHQAGRFEGKGIAEENWQTFEQYYNETFKSE
jgi:hypothetical protein